MFRIEGKTLLDQVSHRHSLNEDDVAYIIRQLCETLAELHSRNVIHLDMRVSLLDVHELKSKRLDI